MTRSILSFSFVIIVVILASSAVRADISGFGDFSGFTINQHDSSAAPSVSGGVLQLTTPADFEERSIFYNTAQNIGQFTASFAYRAVPNTSGGGSGAAFVIQNSAAGASTVETTVQGFNNQNVGYFGIANSVAVSLELRDPTVSGSGLYTGGAYSSSGAATNPLILSTGDVIDATLTYNGTLLTESLRDTVNGNSFNTSYFVNLPSVIGSQTAYVGFTAGTSGFTAQQYFSDFQFASSVPEPASASFVLIGSIALLRRR